MYKDCKICNEIVEYCEARNDYIIASMQKQLKFFKDKKKTQKELAKKSKAQPKPPVAKPEVKIKADKTVVNGEVQDGK